MRIIDSHCHVYPQAIAAKAVKGVSDFYDGVGDFCDGLASTVKEDWKKKGVDHAIVFSVATKLALSIMIRLIILILVRKLQLFQTMVQ